MTDRFDSSDALADWVMPWPAFEVDWDRAALLLIDCQNYGASAACGLIPMFVERHSDVAEYYVPRIRHSISNAQRLLKAFRSVQRDVIFTRHGALLLSGRDMIVGRQQRDSHARDQSDRPTLWPKGSTEHQIVDELAPLDDELVIDKNSSSPFNGTGIDQLLRNLNVETLVIAGMATDMCGNHRARCGGLWLQCDCR